MRKRVFASSFVVTVALADLACDKQPDDLGPTNNPPPPELEEPLGDTKGEPDTKTDGDTKTDADTKGDPEVVNGPDKKPQGITTNVTKTIKKQDDGTCIEYTSVECPPDTKCNPPPPRKVDCPDADLPDAKVAANVHVDAQGKCWEHTPVNCPKGAMCNPPPPRDVKCTPEILAKQKK